MTEMSHCNLYNRIISILEERKVAVDVNILELACKLYCEGKSKAVNFEYLKNTMPNRHKISAVLHIVACLLDDNHPIIPTYINYIEAAREAKRTI